MSQITTHILDTALGAPAEGVSLSLKVLQGNTWVELAAGITNDDGRVPNLLVHDAPLDAGTYCMRFDTAGYLQKTAGKVFYPWVEVVFCLDGSGDHYHIPLLLSPFGYATYRGS